MKIRDLILRAVEAADGWQFVPSHSLVKIPGFTEPVNPSRMGPVALSGLADQLVSQIDQSKDFSFHSTESGRCVVINANPKVDQSERASFHGESRSVNALNAISGSGFFK